MQLSGLIRRATQNIALGRGKDLLSRCLESAQAEAASLEDATSEPALDARDHYLKTVALLKDIQTEMTARPVMGKEARSPAVVAVARSRRMKKHGKALVASLTGLLALASATSASRAAERHAAMEPTFQRGVNLSHWLSQPLHESWGQRFDVEGETYTAEGRARWFNESQAAAIARRASTTSACWSTGTVSSRPALVMRRYWKRASSRSTVR